MSKYANLMLKSHTEAVLYAKARKALRFNFRAAAFFGLMMKGSSKNFFYFGTQMHF